MSLVESNAFKGKGKGTRATALAFRHQQVQVRRCRRERHSVVKVSCSAVVDDGGKGERRKRVIVIGGGWAGFGAAKHLVDQNFDVTLLDASKNAGGLSQGFRVNKYPMEAGMKGMWYQYHNIFSLVEELQIRPNPFTEWTESNFYLPDGLLTEGPVFQKQPRLPTMLGQAMYTFPLFKTSNAGPFDMKAVTQAVNRLQGKEEEAEDEAVSTSSQVNLFDLTSMMSLLPAMLAFDSDEETYEMYDEMSARELFRRSGVTKPLYESFLKPLLLVGLFAPPSELSAASVLETLYFYAAAHQFDFDMCWCNGTVKETLFDPLCEYIDGKGGKILGGKAVVDVNIRDSEVTSVTAKDLDTGDLINYDADAVVFAVGINAMQKIVTASKSLSKLEEFTKIMNLSSIDCVCARIWLKDRLPVPKPANVLGNFEKECGATFFHLNDLHHEFAPKGTGSVFQCDFYHANAIVPLSDEEIRDKCLRNMKMCLGDDRISVENVEHFEVIRAVKAVTHFSVGSHKNRPEQKTSCRNLFISGDWVKNLDHGSKGLSQERAYISGLVAANMICDVLGQGEPAKIIDTEEDEAHIALGKWIAKQSKETGLADVLPSNPVELFNRW